MADGIVTIDTRLDSSGAESGISKLNGKASKVAKVAATTLKTVGVAAIAATGAVVKVGSDFEAQMSTVASIAQTGDKELQQLTDKAKEMGEKTQFSATESGKAFEYMAMAGWKTKDMLNGVEGIMNLAAASGEDLATTSDIVTDAMTAFGLKAKEAGHFSDVLAKTASNSNTNVGLMGETFKYVAPVAGSLGYSIEDTATYIGLMANSGIKASNAGTALRGILSRLASPTDDVKVAMKKLGISLTDSKGNMKTLDEVMQDLRDSFSHLTKEEKAQMASTIAGKNAMSGMLAIVNASEKDYKKLSSAINSADGAAKEMAETRLDNLKGDVTLLKSALEGLGINIYEEANTPLRTVTQTATEMVDALNDAIKNGGIENLANVVGEQLGSVSAKALDKMPDMANVAIKIVGSFCTSFSKSLRSNIPGLIRNLGKVVVELMRDIFGEKAARTVQKFFDTIADNADRVMSAFDKILAKTTDSLGDFIALLLQIATAVIPPLVSALDFLADNFEVVIGLIGGVATGLVAFNILNTVIGLIGSTAAAFGVLNVTMLANPIILFVSAIAGLIAGLAAMNSAIEGTSDFYEEAYIQASALTDKQREQREEIDEMVASYDNLCEKIKTSGEEIGAEAVLAKNYWSELQKITDENGKIKKGYEDRAKAITGELSEALGVEIKIVDGQIQKYGELKNSVDEVIAKKQTEATLDAFKDDYALALKNQSEQWKKIAEAEKEAATNAENFDLAKDTVSRLENRLYALKSAMANATDTSGQERYQEAIRETNEELEMWRGRMKGSETKQKELNKAVENAKTAFSGSAKFVNDYNNVLAASESGSVKKMNKAVGELGKTFETSATGTEKSLKKQVKSTSTSYQNMIKEVKNGNDVFTEEQLKYARFIAQTALGEYEAAGGSLADGYIKGITNKTEELETAVNNMVNKGLKSIKKAQDSHSPSKKAIKLGRQLAQGYVIGFERENASERIAASFKSGMRSIETTMNHEVITKMDSMGYDNIGEKMVSAFEQAGFSVYIGEREFGRLVRKFS